MLIDSALFWFALTATLWLIAAIFSLIGISHRFGRGALIGGGLTCMLGSAIGLPGGTETATLFSLGGLYAHFHLGPAALWLIGWATLPATCAMALGGSRVQTGNRWVFGAAVGLLGALGVFGMQDAPGLLIAWEAMSLGGALMLLAERNDEAGGHAGMFMLSLLEVGAIALLLALAMLGAANPTNSAMSAHFHSLSLGWAVGIGLLLIVGTGAKLGLLPFYEWFPGAYGYASGSTGALFSGIFLSAAWFLLGRALLDWAPGGSVAMTLGVVLLALGVLSAILAILFAFQENDWRRLLGYSTAENAGLAVTALGAALVFRSQDLHALAALAWLVGLIHLAGHSLAKGALLFAADGVHDATGSYRINARGLLRRAPWTLGLGAVFAAMSLAAMPPQIGFVSEWLLFQTIFHSFALHTQGARIALSLAGAGVALIAALALATFVKLLGVGLLGPEVPDTSQPALRYRLAVLINGLAVPALAVGLLWLLPLLTQASWPQEMGQSAFHMVHGMLLVPLSSGFAFISPLKLVIVAPLLAVPAALAVIITIRQHGIRRAPLWSGGLRVDPRHATTALAFSNAMRIFYGFVYRPANDTRRDYSGRHYFINALRFDYAQSPIFTPLLFTPAKRLIVWAALHLRWLQSGFLNSYLAILGGLLLVILAIGLFY